MKTCHKCGLTKNESEFYKNGRKPDGLQSNCKACKKVYNSDHYVKNKDKYNPQRAETVKRARLKIETFLSEYLDRSSCKDCGSTDKVVLEFDHVRGEKKFNIGSCRTTSLTAVKEEILKCEVVCANCHRRRTYERAGQCSWRFSPAPKEQD